MKTKISIRGFLKSQQMLDELRSAIPDSDIIDLDVMQCDNTAFELKNMKSVTDILIIELDSEATGELNSAQELISELDKSTTIFVLLNNSKADVVRLLMRAGIHDVLSLPDNKDELFSEIKEIVKKKHHGMQSRESQVITFMNAKGGCGGTTIAVNTAHTLSNKLDASVCLIDLDIQFGKVALFLDLLAKETVLDALRQPERIDPVFLKALITHHPSGLDILASPGALNDISHISPSAVGMLIEAARKTYDFVLIDMPHLITPWSIEALKKSDRNFLVVQSCFSIIRDAHLLLQKLPDHGIDTKQFELINNRDSKHTGPISKKQMSELLHKDEAFNIHNNYPLVIEAQEAGKPLDKLTIGSSINRDIEHLAKAIKEGKTSKSGNGFFAKMFHQ